MYIVILALVLPAICLASVSDYLTNDDKASLKELFISSKPYSTNDLQSLYYSVSGLNSLGEKILDEKNLCTLLNKDAKNRDVTQLYFTIVASHNIPNCKITLPVSVETILNSAISSASSTRTIYHSVFALIHLNLKVDATKVISSLKRALKADDSPLSHAYSFYTAAVLKTDVTYFFELIEDIIAQADEIDNKYMQFEAGVYTTSVVLESSYKLASSLNKEPSTLKNKIEKFANYLLSRKHTDSIRNSATLLSVFKTLSTNKYHIPLVVALESSVAVTSKNPNVKVRVCTLMGTPVNVDVNMESAKSVKQSAVIISKKDMLPSNTDKSIYQLDLISTSPNTGFYYLSIVVTPKDKNAAIVGLKSNTLKVKVTTKVILTNVKVAVSEKDSPAILNPVNYPNKLSKVLEADNHQSIVINFQVVSTMDKKVLNSIHQTFVCFTNIKTKQAITFIAQNIDDTFKFKIDMGEKEKDFDYTSGKYSIEIIVGDSIIENSIIYNIGSIDLSLSTQKDSEKASLFSTRPEIIHTFRVPDKRPSASITYVFNILVIAPAVLLALMWLRIGANVSNITQICTLSALGFQAGLISIFVLYYFYWIQLNMFDTLRYLGYISVPTFLFGNRVLRSIASKRK